MNAYKATELMDKYSYCPNCGNGAVGNGEGTLNINGDTFERTCKCGWSVKVKETK